MNDSDNIPSSTQTESTANETMNNTNGISSSNEQETDETDDMPKENQSKKTVIKERCPTCKKKTFNSVRNYHIHTCIDELQCVIQYEKPPLKPANNWEIMNVNASKCCVAIFVTRLSTDKIPWKNIRKMPHGK